MKLINLANTAQQFPRDAPLNCFPSASDYENSRRLCFFIPVRPPWSWWSRCFRCGSKKNLSHVVGIRTGETGMRFFELVLFLFKLFLLYIYNITKLCWRHTWLEVWSSRHVFENHDVWKPFLNISIKTLDTESTTESGKQPSIQVPVMNSSGSTWSGIFFVSTCDERAMSGSPTSFGLTPWMVLVLTPMDDPCPRGH